jgi:hypothetical protein
MGGGLMQLVAYGAQDIYLTGNPQITFFKVVYRRHTNFSMESIEQTFNGSVDFGRKVSCTISRNGDLIHRMYLTVNLDNSGTAAGSVQVDNLGSKLVKSVEIEIGGQRIDKHYGDWLYVWNELTQTDGHAAGYEAMQKGKKIYIPLQFWFCRNPGLALPLIALQYHEVKVNVEFNSRSFVLAENVVEDTSVTPIDFTDKATYPLSFATASLWVDYIYLDTDERRRFAQVSHEYLIEQLQFTGSESLAPKLKLNFNHPVKELIWMIKEKEEKQGKSYWKPKSGIYETASLQLNGHERFSARDSMYFQYVQPYQHHETVPASNDVSVYSFALKPEEHQPSGTCNMSRIDNATLVLKYTDSENEYDNNKDYMVSVYAVNYNVLRIMSGMGGLAYSN